jgi:hypothetical protein
MSLSERPADAKFKRNSKDRILSTRLRRIQPISDSLNTSFPRPMSVGNVRPALLTAGGRAHIDEVLPGQSGE